MLSFMRKQAKSWIMKIILILIIVVFIGYFGSRQGDQDAQAIVKVEDKVVTRSDFARKYDDLYKGYRKYLGGNVSEEMLKKLNLKQQALDALINQAIISNYAQKLGLAVSEEDVRDAILGYPAFQSNGVFDPQVYRQLLRDNDLTPADFEKIQQEIMTTAKVESLIKGSAQASDRELFDIFTLQNGKINIQFLRIAPKAFADRVKPSNADLEKYLKDNGNQFRVPEKIQARYISFPAERFVGSARITDADINEHYSFRKAAYEKAGEKSLTPALKEKIIAELKSVKAMEIASQEVKKARDTIYQYDNMDDYAQKNRLQIQQTDFFTVSSPPAELAQIKDIQQQLTGLKKDDLAPIMTTPNGYCLLKVASVKSSYVPALSEVRDGVVKQFTGQEAAKLAQKEAENILETLKKGTAFETAARAQGQPLSETGLFTPNVNIPKIGASKDLAFALLELSEKKPYPDTIFAVDGDYVVVKFEGRSTVDPKEFETKKQELKANYLRMKQSILFQSWMEEQKATLTKKGLLKTYKQAADL